MHRLARGELDAAIAACRQPLEKGRDLAEAHFTVGLALLCAGRRGAAAEAYNAGLELAREWDELEDACWALEKQMRATGYLAGATRILDCLRAARDEFVAQWPAP